LSVESVTHLHKPPVCSSLFCLVMQGNKVGDFRAKVLLQSSKCGVMMIKVGRVGKWVGGRAGGWALAGVPGRQAGRQVRRQAGRQAGR